MLHPLTVEPLVRAALAEDLGRAGDITTDSIVPAEAVATARIASRKDGRVAGLEAGLIAFRLLDPSLSVTVERRDGEDVAPGDTIAVLDGRARALLTAERTALNLMGRLSGIATATRALVRQVEGTKARIVCTRKTTPGLRMLEKHAVRLGGGFNHRFGLDDAVLIKDNHIAVAGGVRPAVERVRAAVGHMVKVEVEVDTLDQLDELLGLPVDVVLLDNMEPDTLRRAVRMVDGRLLTEASGNVTPATVRAIAECGVDMISCGWLTHSAPTLDLGLDM
ncbi:carboxylating nicotinate-nucleotide diphosphorylase [Azospirillum picis]|uniref:nicotinate-nucleotide diphosphorylase (carboxylating) n=1 Tax=Azospirillum picis TaxID=488438 RepID=A0ABU0MDL8_9PROT|nr:carboxylating nicotinate-nucleotide diphosphorylase [Azospirillum picis]MBP2297478.1 nicotinate-nucleotide pyrophosphorylase (carboxylating) [Azospirillum picis]MDQ0531499.1 nicotinate-nucleotide pyrophosphorylase (carboxylating) [Azospirillum picis]